MSDRKVNEHLREALDIGDMASEVRQGDPIEVHVSRIDGRPSDVDSDLVSYSVNCQTEDTYDAAAVYAGAETLRGLSVDASVGELATSRSELERSSVARRCSTITLASH